MKDILKDVKSHKPPETAFDYSTLNTQVLGAIIETVTGRPWNIVISEKIWARSGMESDAMLGLPSAGEALHGGFCVKIA